jgi:putative flippase GtrA
MFLFFVLYSLFRGEDMNSAIQQSISRLARPLRFGVVGLSGIVVNSAILWVLVRELHLAVTLGSVIATEAAILANFLLNDRWTFRGASERLFTQRLLRFNGVALGGMAITAGIPTALAGYTQLPLLVANVLAVGAATGWNYIVNSRWTWNTPQVASHTTQVAVSASATCDLRPATCDLEEVAA